MNRLPRKLDTSRVSDFADLARRTFAFASDVYDFLRLLPPLEVQLAKGQGGSTIRVQTTARPLAVVILAAWAEGSALRASPVTCNWKHRTDGAGVELTSVPGLASGTDYTLVLLLVSGR